MKNEIRYAECEVAYWRKKQKELAKTPLDLIDTSLLVVVEKNGQIYDKKMETKRPIKWWEIGEGYPKLFISDDLAARVEFEVYIDTCQDINHIEFNDNQDAIDFYELWKRKV